jgi:hypothetical protein
MCRLRTTDHTGDAPSDRSGFIQIDSWVVPVAPATHPKSVEPMPPPALAIVIQLANGICLTIPPKADLFRTVAVAIAAS